MNDIGGSWDRRGEFLVNYNADTKDLKVPCEITMEATHSGSTPGRARSMNSTEIEKIADIFNSARTSTTESPTRKKENAGILKAEESIKMGVATTFTHNGITYKITPLKKADTEKVAKLKEIAKIRKETVHLVTVNPNTLSAKRISDTATLSRSSSLSPTTQAPKPPNAKPVERLPQTSWMRFDRYLGFRQDKKIEHNFFEVKLKDEVITDSSKIDAIEAALSTKPEMKALSDAMRKGNDVEITIGKKTYQLVHVNHSTTPETENKKIFDLVESREKWLFNKIMAGPRPAEIEKALAASPQAKSDTTLRASPPQAKPLAPVLRQSITKDTPLGKSVSDVSKQIISPTGTVARRPAPPIPPQDTVGRKGAQALPPLPTPPASRRNSLTRSVASSPSATPSPTVAPRPDLWNDKKTNALMEKFLLISINYRQPILTKDHVDAILKDHYDKLSKDARAQFDISLGENEVIKFGEYSLIPKK